MIGAEAQDIAITTGASGGFSAVAAGMDWKPGDEVLVGRGEFPSHFSTWVPYENAGKLRVRMIEPRGRFIAASDYEDQIGPQHEAGICEPGAIRQRRTSGRSARGEGLPRGGRGILAGHFAVRGSDADRDSRTGRGLRRLAADTNGCSVLTALGFSGCRRSGPSGCMQVRCTGWRSRVRAILIRCRCGRLARSGGRAALGFAGDGEFHQSRTAGTLRSICCCAWEWRQSPSHTRALTREIIERLPRDRCALASPAEEERRGPYVCVVARKAGDTAGLYEKLREAQVIVSLRENALRIAPYLYNTAEDVSRLVKTLSVS